jgi:hypothetical protein
MPPQPLQAVVHPHPTVLSLARPVRLQTPKLAYMDSFPIGHPTSEGVVGTDNKQDITVKLIHARTSRSSDWG